MSSDDRAEAATPIACDLVCAVKDGDAERIDAILTDPDADLMALAVVLAAMVPDDRPLHELLGDDELDDDEPVLDFTARRIVTAAAVATSQRVGVPSSAILGKSRERDIVQARQVVAWVACHEGLGYSEVGRQLGRDHTTVMHSVAKVTADRDLYRLAMAVLSDITAVAA